MIYTTCACARFGHPEIQIRVSSNAVPQGDIAWFLQFLEDRVAAGAQFRAGQTLQVGWMITRIEEASERLLRVTEPDMQVVPIRFVDSIDRTLMHLRNQKDVVESLQPAPSLAFPSLQQSAVTHKSYKAARRLLLTRYEPRDADSGWMITNLDDTSDANSPENYVLVSLYQLGIDRPDLIRFLAVPAGLQVVIDGFVGVLGPDGEISQAPGSYLAELNRLAQQRSG